MESEQNLYKRNYFARPNLPNEEYFYNRGSVSNNMPYNIEMDTMQQHTHKPSGTDMASHVHRTTSKHRNKDLKYNRTLTRKLEERMGWMQPAGDIPNDTSLLEHANHIVSCMEQDAALMEDTPASEQARLEALKNMPQCLTMKRHIKDKLSRSVSQKSKYKPISCFKRMKYRSSIAWSKFKNNCKNFAYRFELWYSSLKVIEGQFGSGVATYFKFLRWLFMMNCFFAIIVISFLVIPQLCFRFFKLNDGKAVVINNAYTDNEPFQFKHIFTGAGFFTNTTLYYGFYTNESVSLSNNWNYSIPDAYFFTMFCLYIICFIIFSMSMAKSYRKSFIETEGGLNNIYAHKIFCGWDYSIATKEAARLKSTGIYQELKELLSDYNVDSYKNTCFVKFCTIILQLIVNIFILSILSGTGYMMWNFLITYKKDINETDDGALITAVVVNGIMLIYPMAFSFIIRYEYYKNPRVILYITLARTFLLEVVILGILVAYWLQQTKNEHCWETLLGQEVYRLIIFDFIISVLLVSILEILYAIFRKFVFHSLEPPEFNIARHTLQIIYNQTIFWLGFFFSPWLSIIVVLKLFLTWYIRETIALHFCKPSTKSWRAAQTQTWYLIISFISLLLVIAFYGFLMVQVPTSNCGPFREYPYIYEMVLAGVFQLEQGNEFWKIIMYITKPGVIALILIAMCVRVYYLSAKAHAQRGMVKMLREMLAWEAKDKEFLLQNIGQLTEGRWQYNVKESRGFVPVKELPYVGQQIRERRKMGEYESGDMPRGAVQDNSGMCYQDEPSSTTSVEQRFSQYKKYH